MSERELQPVRISRLTQVRMDYGLPFRAVEPPELRPLPYPGPDLFDAPPPITGGYDSYALWTKKKSLKLHHIIEVAMGFASRSGNVFDAKGRRVELASHKSKANKKTFLYNRNAWKSVKPAGIKPTFSYDGEIFVVTSSTAKFYYHYLLETVPRLHIMQKMGLGSHVPVYVDASQPFMKECLRALNIENIIDASVYPRIHARKLIVPCYEIGSYDSIPKWTIELLNELFPNMTPDTMKPRRKLYLSRKNAGRRRMINDAEIATYLESEGFETVFPETLSIQEQANLFRQAQFIAGPSGGAFTNVVFCRPGAIVLNLFHWQSDNCFQKLCNVKTLPYAYVGSRLTVSERLKRQFSEIEPGYLDYEIELSDLRKTYEKII